MKYDANCVPKVIGADAELGNLILGLDAEHGTGREASRALLHEISGVSSNGARTFVNSGSDYSWSENGETPWTSSDVVAFAGTGTTAGTHYNPQDIGRKYLPTNAGCIYIDLDHLEICTPETLSARDFVAAWHAMLRITRGALAAANAKRPRGQRIVVLVNSSDGRGNAYGSHLSFLVTRRLWDELFLRRLHPGLFVLAAYQVSSIVFAGQGKVGTENGRPRVAYQITQRGDFFDQIVGPQTTHNRPLVNSRDEPLCGAGEGRAHATGAGTGLARLHCIFYDSTLAQASTLLKVGVMQIVLSMLEAGRLDARLMLDDPLRALVAYNHDPDLNARAPLVDGRVVSAVELQSMFCEHARAYVDAGGCDGLVPGASTIVELWEDTLDKLARRDFDRLAPRLDWVLKRVQIERALVKRGLDWSAAEAKHLDHLYSSLDEGEGLYWALEAAGFTEQFASEAAIERFVGAPPEDTRAWTRAMILRQVPAERIRRVDWDHIELAPADFGRGPTTVIALSDPLGHTRESWNRGAERDAREAMTAALTLPGDDRLTN